MYNPDTVPSFAIQRGLIYGAKCPISHAEFLNLSDDTIDDSIKKNDLIAAQKRHTWGIIYAQDSVTGSYVPRNRSMEDRRRIWLSEQQ